MSANTKIPWCDKTFNGWIGCEPCSEGCANCYAAAMDRRWGHDSFGKGKPRRRTSAANWRQPLRWNQIAASEKFVECTGCKHRTHHLKWPDGMLSCQQCGSDAWLPVRPRIFCGSMCDWLDDEVPIEWLADLLALVHQCQSLDFLLLTKRPGNWSLRLHDAIRYMERQAGRDDNHLPESGYDFAVDWFNGKAPSNIWLGFTVENQEWFDDRWGCARNIPAQVVFCSHEPSLGPLFLPESFLERKHRAWLICGGESGPHARPMHPDWAYSLRDQCKEDAVPFFFKQWGEWRPCGSAFPAGKSISIKGMVLTRVGKKRAGHLLDGMEHREFPEVRG